MKITKIALSVLLSMHLKTVRCGMVIHTRSLSTCEAEAGLAGVQGQPELYSETPFQKLRKKKST